MSNPKLEEFNVKMKRLHVFMDQKGYDAVVIGTRTNWEWLSCGGSSTIEMTSNAASTLLIVTKEKNILVAYTMDFQRALDDELDGFGFEAVTISWTDLGLEQKASDLLDGKKVLSDIPLPLSDVVVSMKEFYNLHYPLTDWEIDRYSAVCKDAEWILKSVVENAGSGIKESEFKNRMVSEFALNGYTPGVLLMGSDERNLKYRHPIATEKKIDNYLLLILVFRKFGLSAVLTRSVCYKGSLDAELQKKFAAASTIAANCIAMTIPGTKFSDVLVRQKELYQELGYENEWKNHFQGGITGYIINDSTLCMDENALMVARQAHNWFVTITGVNTEDTYISTVNKNLTCTGAWPIKPHQVGSREISLPDIWYM